jgi:hypothetical protein
MSNAAPVIIVGGNGNAADVTADGKLEVDATITATAESTAEATAAAPTYTEGQDAPISQDLAGHLRTRPLASGTMTATQVTVPATSNGILILAANAARKGATISNPGSVSVYIQQAATGVTTSNGFAIPPGASYNIDSPLYTGAVYGIVATGTNVVTVVELT